MPASTTKYPEMTAIAPNTRMPAAEAAAYLGVAEKTLRKMTSERRVPFIRISSRCVRYDKAALDRWIEERSIPARS